MIYTCTLCEAYGTFEASVEKIYWGGVGGGGGGGGGTDWVGKELTGYFFPLGKELTSQFLPQGRNGPAYSFPGEETDWGRNCPLHRVILISGHFDLGSFQTLQFCVILVPAHFISRSFQPWDISAQEVYLC